MKLPDHDQLSKYSDFRKTRNILLSDGVPSGKCLVITLPHSVIPAEHRDAFRQYVTEHIDEETLEYAVEMWEEPEDKEDVILITRLPLELIQAYMKQSVSQA